MKAYCGQIIYTSSVAADASGAFGVRAVAGSVDGDMASAIAASFAAQGYPVAEADIVTSDSLRADPDALSSFPPIYEFRSFDVAEGVRRYVAARTVYLGADPRFFLDNAYSGVDRGVNSLTHMLVFDGRPSLSLFDRMDAAGAWIPRNISDVSDSGELALWASGEPVEPAKPSVAFRMADARDFSLSATLLPGSAGELLLQALIVRRLRASGNGKERSLPRIIAVVGNPASFTLLLAEMPEALTADLTFASGMARHFAIPDSLEMAVVTPSELETLNRSGAIVVDFTEHSIDMAADADCEIAAEVIALFCKASDMAGLSAFLKRFFGNEKMSKKFGEECMHYVAASTSLPLLPGRVDSALLKRCDKLKGNARRSFVARLGGCIEAMLGSSSGLAISNGLRLRGEAVARFGELPAVSPDIISRLARILFRRGESAYLGRILNADNVAAAAAVVAPEQMGPLEPFLRSLAQSDSPEVWKVMIGHYFGGVYSTATRAVLGAIAGSELHRRDKERLIMQLFPLKSQMAYLSEIVDWYRDNPEAIVHLSAPLLSIVMSAREECFSRFIGPESSPAVLKKMRQHIIDYFRPRILKNPSQAMSMALIMAERMTAEVFGKLKLVEPIVGLWLDQAYATPTQSAVRVIDSVRSLSLTLPDAMADRMNSLHCLLSGRVPLKVTSEVLLFALRLSSVELRQISRMARVWASSAPVISELRHFMKEAAISDPAVAGVLIDAFWLTESRPVVAERNSYVVAVYDLARWNSEERLAYINGLSDSKLAALLRGKDTFTGRLWRRLFPKV